MKNFILAGLRCWTQEGKGSEDGSFRALTFRGSAFTLVLIGTAMTPAHVIVIFCPADLLEMDTRSTCSFSCAIENSLRM